MNTQSPVLSARNLGKRVQGPEGGLDLLQDITLEVNAGDSLAITGPSGSGKSTLLSLLAGLDVPTSGEVLLGDKPFSSGSEDQRARLRGEQCGFVFQHFQLVADLTAQENVMLPLEILGRGKARDTARHWLAGNSNALRWPGPLRCRPPCCSPMSPPVAWIMPMASMWQTCCFP